MRWPLDGKYYMNWRIGLLLQYKYTENVPTYQRALAFREMGTIDMLALALNDFDHALTLNPQNDMIQPLHSKVNECMTKLLTAYVKKLCPLPAIPSSWASWSYNELFAEQQLKLDAVKPLIDIAQRKKRKFVPFLYYGDDLLNVEWVFLLHFARELQGAHEGYPDGVPGRYSGPNAAIHQIYGRVALIVSTIFQFTLGNSKPL